MLLLDIALDNYLRTLLERQDKGVLGGDDLCELIALSLRNAVIAIDSEDLRQVRRCPSCTHYVCVRRFSTATASSAVCTSLLVPPSARHVCTYLYYRIS